MFFCTPPCTSNTGMLLPKNLYWIGLFLGDSDPQQIRGRERKGRAKSRLSHAIVRGRRELQKQGKEVRNCSNLFLGYSLQQIMAIINQLCRPGWHKAEHGYVQKGWSPWVGAHPAAETSPSLSLTACFFMWRAAEASYGHAVRRQGSYSYASTHSMVGGWEGQRELSWRISESKWLPGAMRSWMGGGVIGNNGLGGGGLVG